MKLGISAAGALVLAATLAVPTPVSAQPRAVPAPQAGFTFTREERVALGAVSQAVQVRNWPAAAAAIPAAQAAARSPSARYALGRFEFEIGVGTRNPEQQLRGIDTIMNSGVALPEEVSGLLRHQAQLHNERREYERAENALNRLAQLQPNDPETFAMLAQLSRNRNNAPQTVTLLQRSLEASDVSGRRAPESRYRMALALALQGAQRAQTADLARRLVTAYPSAINWRDALISYREVAQPDPALTLDIQRLMRASGALAGERDYMAAATAFDQANLPGEAKAVLDEGVSRGMLTASEAATRALITRVNGRATTDRTALTGQVTRARAAATGAAARAAGDSLYGHGRYAEAAELYRLALSKGGENADLVNTRLGAALALANQPVEAQAALQAVTGQRAEIARLWLAFLASRPAA